MKKKLLLLAMFPILYSVNANAGVFSGLRNIIHTVATMEVMYIGAKIAAAYGYIQLPSIEWKNFILQLPDEN